METYSPVLDCQARAGALLAPISDNCVDIRVGSKRMCEMCQLVTDEILRCMSLYRLVERIRAIEYQMVEMEVF